MWKGARGGGNVVKFGSLGVHRGTRDEKFSISPTIIVALTVFRRRAFSIAPPAVECILFANRNETDRDG